MRPTRALTVLIATLVALAMPLTLVAAADAAPDAAKPHRTFKVVGKEPRDDVFYMVGTVGGGYKSKKLFILRRVGQGKVTVYKSVRTNRSSTFQTRIYGPPRGKKLVCYYARTPAGATYAASTSKGICIRRIVL